MPCRSGGLCGGAACARGTCTGLIRLRRQTWRCKPSCSLYLNRTRFRTAEPLALPAVEWSRLPWRLAWRWRHFSAAAASLRSGCRASTRSRSSRAAWSAWLSIWQPCSRDPARYKEYLRQYLSLGLEVARGMNLWPQYTPSLPEEARGQPAMLWSRQPAWFQSVRRCRHGSVCLPLWSKALPRFKPPWQQNDNDLVTVN